MALYIITFEDAFDGSERSIGIEATSEAKAMTKAFEREDVYEIVECYED